MCLETKLRAVSPFQSIFANIVSLEPLRIWFCFMRICQVCQLKMHNHYLLAHIDCTLASAVVRETSIPLPETIWIWRISAKDILPIFFRYFPNILLIFRFLKPFGFGEYQPKIFFGYFPNILRIFRFLNDLDLENIGQKRLIGDKIRVLIFLNAKHLSHQLHSKLNQCLATQKQFQWKLISLIIGTKCGVEEKVWG